jgi:hypothetical protein
MKTCESSIKQNIQKKTGGGGGGGCNKSTQWNEPSLGKWKNLQRRWTTKGMGILIPESPLVVTSILDKEKGKTPLKMPSLEEFHLQ